MELFAGVSFTPTALAVTLFTNVPLVKVLNQTVSVEFSPLCNGKRVFNNALLTTTLGLIEPSSVTLNLVAVGFISVKLPLTKVLNQRVKILDSPIPRVWFNMKFSPFLISSLPSAPLKYANSLEL